MVEFSFIYEDNHLLVLDKPPGISTQNDNAFGDSLTSLAQKAIKVRDQKPGNVFLHPIHRLDNPVSGLVVFAKSAKALSRLQKAMRCQKIVKIYQAIVEGELKNEKNLHLYLAHGDREALVSNVPRKGFKEAMLEYQILLSCESHSFINILLKTGRYHQIRAMFSYLGHPIIGDHKYGSKRTVSEGILLHHREVHIPHPTKNELKHFYSPLPIRFLPFLK
jgi:23S rRNA pseudouridine1911/1915/1917 synthase